MSDGEDLAELLEKATADRAAKHAKALADMFIQPSTCRHCGAQVAIPEQHKAFHDGIEKWMQGVIDALEKAGFERREDRAQRRSRLRTPIPLPEDGEKP